MQPPYQQQPQVPQQPQYPQQQQGNWNPRQYGAPQQQPKPQGFSLMRLVRLFLIVLGLLAQPVGLYNIWDGVQSKYGGFSCSSQYTHLITIDPAAYDESVALCKRVATESIQMGIGICVFGVVLFVVGLVVGRKKTPA